MRYLVDFSSGIDSVAALCSVLQEDPTGVYEILHIQIRTGCDNLWQAQLIATHNILPVLRKEYPGAKFIMLESPVVEFKTHVLKTDIIFTTLFNTVLLNENHNAYRYIIHGAFRYIKEHCNNNHGWRQSMTMLAAFGLFPKFYRPNEGKDKYSLYLSVPESIRGLTWACNRPILEGDFFIHCGKCSKCKELESAGIPFNSIDMTDAYDFIDAYVEYNKASKNFRLSQEEIK